MIKVITLNTENRQVVVEIYPDGSVYLQRNKPAVLRGDSLSFTKEEMREVLSTLWSLEGYCPPGSSYAAQEKEIKELRARLASKEQESAANWARAKTAEAALKSDIEILVSEEVKRLESDLRLMKGQSDYWKRQYEQMTEARDALMELVDRSVKLEREKGHLERQADTLRRELENEKQTTATLRRSQADRQTGQKPSYWGRLYPDGTCGRLSNDENDPRLRDGWGLFGGQIIELYTKPETRHPNRATNLPEGWLVWSPLLPVTSARLKATEEEAQKTSIEMTPIGRPSWQYASLYEAAPKMEMRKPSAWMVRDKTNPAAYYLYSLEQDADTFMRQVHNREKWTVVPLFEVATGDLAWYHESVKLAKDLTETREELRKMTCCRNNMATQKRELYQKLAQTELSWAEDQKRLAEYLNKPVVAWMVNGLKGHFATRMGDTARVHLNQGAKVTELVEK